MQKALIRLVAIAGVLLLGSAFVGAAASFAETHVSGPHATDNGFTSGKMPSDLQMDSDFATVPSTSLIQIASPANTISPTDVRNADDTSHPQFNDTVTSSASSIIKRQHALRI
jgi:hypothetical protein